LRFKPTDAVPKQYPVEHVLYIRDAVPFQVISDERRSSTAQLNPNFKELLTATLGLQARNKCMDVANWGLIGLSSHRPNESNHDV
jgi:hypothetical protein